ncbi:hypothetical protein DINM_000927 [Dirofilaria immitis]|nr:hypothetical protein [Dirofilaria immitis]
MSPSPIPSTYTHSKCSLADCAHFETARSTQTNRYMYVCLCMQYIHAYTALFHREKSLNLSEKTRIRLSRNSRNRNPGSRNQLCLPMASEVSELAELLNCIRQFETDIKSENDEIENWRQYLIINEQKARKLTKVKQELQCTLRNSKLEVSQMREKVRKAKKNFDYCNKQVAEYTAAIEVARCEQNEMERENKSHSAYIIPNLRIDAKLKLLDDMKGPRQEDVSTVQIPNDTLIPFLHPSHEI